MCRTCLTRRRFLAAGAAAVPVAGCDEAPDLVSDQAVEAMGLRAWQEIRQDTEISRNSSYQDALDDVARRLLRASGASASDWEFVVFARPDVNAFALPGGKIGVFEGMFGVVENSDQLAAIVGHEIGHIEAEHAQERMNAQVAKSAGIRILAFLLDLGEVEYAEEIAAALGIGVDYGLFLPYSRKQELEADRLGLMTMAGAGYDPREAIDLWQRMDAVGGDRPPEFLATHPAPESRIEALRAMLPDVL